MRILITLVALLAAGCASYTTPGSAVDISKIDRTDVAEAMARQPAAMFPARIAIVRVQAPDYRSHSSQPLATGAFSVVTTQDLLTDEQVRQFEGWPQVAGIAPLNRLLLPASLGSLDDLRVAAAKLQADVLLVYTLDTAFRVQGRGYGPLAAISLGLVPDRDAFITSTASALFTDVRTGFVYGAAEATAKASGLTNVWGSSDTIDRQRLEAEAQAFAGLVTEAARTWGGIVRQHDKAQ